MLDTIPPFHSDFLRFCVQTTPQEKDCSHLIIAQMLSAGTATPNVPVKVRSPREAVLLFGRQSIAAKMAELHFCACGGMFSASPLYVLPVEDDDEGVAPIWELTVTGTATESRRLNIELPNGAAGGIEFADKSATKIYQVFTSVGDTASEIATAIAASINADPSRFFQASATSGVVTFTGVHKGTAFNGVIPNFEPFYGAAIPAGVTLAWAVDTAGSGDPSIATALGNLGECCYDCWSMGFNAAAAVDLVVAELENRWACGTSQMCMGHLFHHVQLSVSSTVTAVTAMNDAVRTVIPMPLTYKLPGFFLTAAWAARVCCESCTQPGRPVVRDNGILSCLYDQSPCGIGPFTSLEREQLAEAGAAVWSFGRDGLITIQNNLTTYKFNVYGDPDRTWRRVESRYLVKAIVNELTNFYRTFYSSSRLVSNGVPFRAGEKTTSPSAFKAHLIGHLEGQSDTERGILGVLVDDNALADNLLVERDTVGKPVGVGDPDRLNVGFHASLVGALLRIGTTIDVRV